QLAERPHAVLGVSQEPSKIAVAVHLDLQTFEEQWKLCMAELPSTPPKLDVLAKREGGYVEQIENQDVVWTPRNFYVLSFPQNIVGLILPASRQALAQGLRSILVKPRTFPPSWADRAFFRA